MMSEPSLLLFAGACLALTLTPGPDMLLIASRSISQGRRAGFATLAGIQLGTYCHALAAAFGLSQLFLAVPVAYDVVRFAGAIYLLYLAWRMLKTAPAEGPAPLARPRPVAAIFRQGLLTNLLNPKMALFVLALFPQFVDPAAGSVALQIMLLATVLNLVGLVVNGAVIFTAGGLGARLAARQKKPSRIPGMLLASVYTGLACKLALSSRQ